MDFLDVLQKWWWLIAGPGVVATGIALLFLRSQFATKGEFKRGMRHLEDAIDGLSGRIDEHTVSTDRRLQTLEARTDHLPTLAQFHELGKQIARLEEQQKASVKWHQATGESVKRIEEYLLNKGDKS